MTSAGVLDDCGGRIAHAVGLVLVF
jgi:hypothetical protein